MRANEFTPDNNSAGKVKQGYVVDSFLFKANHEFAEPIEKRVCDPNAPAACAKVGVVIQVLLLLTSGPNIMRCFCAACRKAAYLGKSRQAAKHKKGKAGEI